MTDLERKQDRAPVPAGWDYAPAPEARDLVQLRERYGHFVGGEWLEPSETYTTKSAAADGIDSVKKNASTDARYERKVAKDNSPYFVLTAANLVRCAQKTR